MQKNPLVQKILRLAQSRDISGQNYHPIFPIFTRDFAGQLLRNVCPCTETKKKNTHLFGNPYHQLFVENEFSPKLKSLAPPGGRESW